MGCKGGRRVRLTTSTTSVRGLSTKCRILDVSPLYEPPQPLIGITLLRRPRIMHWIDIKEFLCKDVNAADSAFISFRMLWY
jgi:hypothetical protein